MNKPMRKQDSYGGFWENGVYTSAGAISIEKHWNKIIKEGSSIIRGKHPCKKLGNAGALVDSKTFEVFYL